MPKQPYKNSKYSPQQVLNLLWAIRLNDKFYFDTYGKEWLKEMNRDAVKRALKKIKDNKK